MSLSLTKLKHLKSLAHSLKPVVRVGQHGITDSVIKELEGALDHHELLKVKVSASDRDLRSKMIDQLLQKTQADCVQSIGSVAVLFRRNKKKPVIELPAD